MSFIWYGGSADNREIILFLPSSPYTTPSLFCFSHCHCSEERGKHKGVGTGHSQDSQHIQGIFHKIRHHAGCRKQGKGRGRSDLPKMWSSTSSWGSFSQVTAAHDSTLLSWGCRQLFGDECRVQLGFYNLILLHSYLQRHQSFFKCKRVNKRTDCQAVDCNKIWAISISHTPVWM